MRHHGLVGSEGIGKTSVVAIEAPDFRSVKSRIMM